CTLHLQLAYAHCICTLHLQLAFTSKHLHIALAHCTCTLHLQGTQDRGCEYFMWKDHLMMHLSSSPRPSTPPSSFPGPSTRQSYSLEPSGSPSSHGKEK
ncbi:hypothetical protein Tco_0882241, partial [Tanacetum coccineum]